MLVVANVRSTLCSGVVSIEGVHPSYAVSRNTQRLSLREVLLC